IQFLTGQRAFMDYSSKFKSIRSISNLLSSSDDDIAVKVEKLFKDKADLEREVRSGREELISARSSLLVDDSEKLDGVRVIKKIYDNYDFKALSQLGSHISNNYEMVVQIYGISNDGLGQFIISRSKDISLDLGNLYKQLSLEFKLKGGGNPNTVQGSVPTDNLDKLLQRSREIITQMIRAEG
ncbi:MAG: DHHA1 domain-containing protein, partial [Gudongella sp.]|nr:DHHA1 domain-containing protein [Gudongella sp.]